MVVDDEPLVRKGLALLLGVEPDLVVCGEAAGERQALKRIKAAKADLAVVDLSLKQGSGLNLIRQLRQHCPGLKIVVFSMHAQASYVALAVAAGAHGYVVKSEDIDNLAAAFRSVMRGGFYLSPAMAGLRSSLRAALPPACRPSASARPSHRHA